MARGGGKKKGGGGGGRRGDDSDDDDSSNDGAVGVKGQQQQKQQQKQKQQSSFAGGGNATKKEGEGGGGGAGASRKEKKLQKQQQKAARGGGGGGKPHDSDSDPNDPVTALIHGKVKNNYGNDDDDDESESDNDNRKPARSGGSGGRKNKTNKGGGRGAGMGGGGRGGGSDSGGGAKHHHDNKKGGDASSSLGGDASSSLDDDDNDDDDEKKHHLHSKKKAASKKKKGNVNDDDSSSDDDNHYKGRGKKEKGKKEKGGGGRQNDHPLLAKKAAVVENDDDDDDDDVDLGRAPSIKGRGGGGGKGNGRGGGSKAGRGGGDRSRARGAGVSQWVVDESSSSSSDSSGRSDNDHDHNEGVRAAIQPVNSKNKQVAAIAAAPNKKTVDGNPEQAAKDNDDDASGGDDDKEEEEPEPANVQQVAMVLADDDWGLGSKKSKKKDKDKEQEKDKEKKEKKDKKEKKQKKEKEGREEKKKDKKAKKDKEREVQDSDHVDMTAKAIPELETTVRAVEPEPVPSTTIAQQQHETPPAPQATTATLTATAAAAAVPVSSEAVKTKSKFELQMEAALKKKAEEEAKAKEAAAAQKGSTNNNSKYNKDGSKRQAEPEPEPDWVDTTKSNGPVQVIESQGDGEELMYGAPDDVVWSDKSHAQRQADGDHDGDDDDDHAMMFGPDGKKLSNKERKKLVKARQAAEREAAFEATAAKASREGAQFACSQTAVNENDPQWENSLDVNIPNFSISAAGKILFKDAALTIGHGRRYGLVGPNGRGKSTLLKMIASGDLKLPPRIDFLYVEQEVVADDTPAVEAVLKADTRRWNLLQEEKHLMRAVDAGDESESVIVRLQQVVDELTNMGADSAEASARRILYGLGFGMEMQTKPTKMFSGGWRMRISLARALFVAPTLLMLDEPTNHLDLNAVIWLDEYLQRWKKTLLVVSHDQDFLNSVCEEILHIEDLKLISYKGNYDSFKKAEKQKFIQQVKSWEKQEKRLRELKKSGQSKEKAQETLKKSVAKRESGARSQKKKNDAVAAGSESAEMAELIKRPREYQVKLEFAEVAELARPIIEVNNVHFRYSPKHPIIFDCVDFGIDMDSRICVVGPNGAGKSTLLKLLTGELDPTTGDVRRNPRLRMGIYNQHFVERLPMTKTPIEHLRDRFPDEEYQSIRNRLGRYGLEGHAHEVTMRDLSGGQKARVVFVELSLQRPHVLLLDEPTNNLDIETIDALCEAINAFNGGIVVVTHDQRLIEECDCSLWVVEKRGVTKWEDGFDDYKANILRQLEEEVEREATIRRLKLEAAAVAKAEKIARLACRKQNVTKNSSRRAIMNIALQLLECNIVFHWRSRPGHFSRIFVVMVRVMHEGYYDNQTDISQLDMTMFLLFQGRMDLLCLPCREHEMSMVRDCAHSHHPGDPLIERCLLPSMNNMLNNSTPAFCAFAF